MNKCEHDTAAVSKAQRVEYWKGIDHNATSAWVESCSLEYWLGCISYLKHTDRIESVEYLRNLRRTDMAKKVEVKDAPEATMRDQFYEDLHGAEAPKNPNEKDISPEEKASREKEAARYERRQQDLRNIFADWLEDNNEHDASECVRFTAAERKWPYSHAAATAEQSVAAAWFNAGKITAGMGHESSDLPEDLYKALEGGKEIANHRLYPSLREAEEALVASWKKVRGAK
jgi:hypothetical protein